MATKAANNKPIDPFQSKADRTRRPSHLLLPASTFRRCRRISSPLAVALALMASLLLLGCAPPAGPGSTTSGSQRPTSTSTMPTTTAGPTATSITYASTTTTKKATTTTKKTTTTTLKAGKEYDRLPSDEKVVALTFDGAYDAAPLPSILATLKAAGVHATFFLTGEFARDFEGSVKSIVAAGHDIGSHSYSHPYFTKLSDKALADELEKTEAQLHKAGAPDPKPLFRPPYGDRDKRVLSLLGAHGYVSVVWTIDTIDWDTKTTAAQIKERILNKLQPGAIILMHIAGPQTAGVLPEVIRMLKDRGYGFVGLREGLGLG
jgi:peptidoglycan/xylan/chitin deacetylase (PgdA/CDA1 family)